MKILHTADWHLGKRLDRFSRLEEQREVLNEICEIADAEKVDAVIVAGDLFDTFNPPAEAVELFYKTLKRLSANGTRAVIAIAGNHDQPERIEAPDPLARECGIVFLGFPDSQVVPFALDSGIAVTTSGPGFLEIKIPSADHPLRILATAYANEIRLRTCLDVTDSEEELRALLETKWQDLAREHCDDKGINVLASHHFLVEEGGEVPDEPEDEKPILHVGGAQAVFTKSIPSQIQYTALGHLHQCQPVGGAAGEVFYSGSPLAYSFSETDQDKHVMIVDATPGGKATVETKLLTQGRRLLRGRFESVDEAVAWLTGHPVAECFVELTMVTEDFLTVQQRKTLVEAHEGIVAIIPEVTGGAAAGDAATATVDTTKSLPELFVDYFRAKHSQEPPEEILSLFAEVLGEGDE